MLDPREQLRLFAADIALRLERAAPLIAIVSGASRSDPELAALLSRLHEDRRRNLRILIEAVAKTRPLRLDEDDALDTLWALTSPELHQVLVRLGGWTGERYAGWVAESLQTLLLEPE